MNTSCKSILRNVFGLLRHRGVILSKNQRFHYRFSDSNQNFKEKEEVKEEEKGNEKKESPKPSSKKTSEPEPNSPSYREKIRDSYPTVGKGLDFCVSAWKQTFPTQRSMADIKRKKRAAPKPSDEELPEWKKGAIIKGKDEVTVKSKLKETLEQTSVYKDLLKSEQYKKYQEFSKATEEFKEDLKDHLHNHPNAFVQTSLGLVSKVSAGSTSSRAIDEMRKLRPGFDLWDLEEDARGIFEHVYTLYLRGDVEELQNIASETALAYFKALIRKREVEKSEPRHKEVWNLERAYFNGAQIMEQGVPVFSFTIKSQEIYCMVSLKDPTKIVDGDEDRIMQYEYSFTLKPKLDYDEESEYEWEMTECQPRQVVMMLA